MESLGFLIGFLPLATRLGGTATSGTEVDLIAVEKSPRDVKERAGLEVFIARGLYGLSLEDWKHLTDTFTFGGGASKAELDEIIRQSIKLWTTSSAVVVPAHHGAAAMGERAVGDGRRITSDAGHWPAEAERAAGTGAAEEATGAGL